LLPLLYGHETAGQLENHQRGPARAGLKRQPTEVLRTKVVWPSHYGALQFRQGSMATSPCEQNKTIFSISSTGTHRYMVARLRAFRQIEVAVPIRAEMRE
jgi:hypothetical protein